MKKYDVTGYCISSENVGDGIKIAVLADLHGRTDRRIIDRVAENKPDVVVVPGDFALIDRNYVEETKATERESYVEGAPAPQWIAEPWTLRKYNPGVVEFLSELARIAPTYLSLGNHEWMIPEDEINEIKDSRIHILDNTYHKIKLYDNEIVLGGLTSAEVMLIRGFVEYQGYPEYKWRHEHFEHTDTLKLDWMDKFKNETGLKVLLCHHPEYMLGGDPVVDLTGVDIALAGHAHGGQMRLGHRGLYAPGQGLFPKYTEGVFEKDGSKVVISRGLSNTYRLPRINNAPEIVVVNVDGAFCEARRSLMRF